MRVAVAPDPNPVAPSFATQVYGLVALPEGVAEYVTDPPGLMLVLFTEQDTVFAFTMLVTLIGVSGPQLLPSFDSVTDPNQSPHTCA